MCVACHFGMNRNSFVLLLCFDSFIVFSLAICCCLSLGQMNDARQRHFYFWIFLWENRTILFYFCTEIERERRKSMRQWARRIAKFSWLQLHSTQFAVFRTICFDLWLSSFRLATFNSFELNRARCTSCTKEMGGFVCVWVSEWEENERGKKAKKRLGVLATRIQRYSCFRFPMYRIHKRAVDDVTSTTIFFCFSNVEAFYTYR